MFSHVPGPMVDALELPKQLGPRFDSELVLSFNWWGRGDSVVRLARLFTHIVSQFTLHS